MEIAEKDLEELKECTFEPTITSRVEGEEIRTLE
jgi:hypothetical protein